MPLPLLLRTILNLTLRQHPLLLHITTTRDANVGEERGRQPMGEYAFASEAPLSSLRLLRLLKQPHSESDSFPTHHLELDESDVVWSSASEILSSSPSPSAASAYGDRDSVDRFSSPSPDLVRSPLLASSCSPSGLVLRPFTCDLSAAVEEDRLPMEIQRCPAGRPEEASVIAWVGHHQSAPVNVPEWPRWMKGPKADVLHGLEEDEGWEDEKANEEEEMVPPHLIVARSHVMTLSVFEGVGRTLKGRDLRRVRNAVLQKTGFLDL